MIIDSNERTNEYREKKEKEEGWSRKRNLLLSSYDWSINIELTQKKIARNITKENLRRSVWQEQKSETREASISDWLENEMKINRRRSVKLKQWVHSAPRYGYANHQNLKSCCQRRIFFGSLLLCVPKVLLWSEVLSVAFFFKARKRRLTVVCCLFFSSFDSLLLLKIHLVLRFCV